MKTKKKTAIKAVTPGTLFRQGDVLLRAVDVSEEKLEPAIPLGPGPGLLLAIGETSGHGHYIFGKGARLMQYKQGNSHVVIVADAGADMRVVGGGSGGVDRHTPIALAPGHYAVVIQRSYDAGMARQVQD